MSTAARSRFEVDAPRFAKDPMRGFASPREFFETVMKRRGDERLQPFDLGVLAAAGADEQGAYSDPHGGFLLPPAMHPTELAVSAPGDPRAGTYRFNMQFGTESIPARVDKNHTTSASGGLTLARVPETIDAMASRMAFEQINLEAKTLLGVSFATSRMVMDSAPQVAAILERGFADESKAVLLREALFGTGTGEFLGALAPHDALIVVAKEGGQAADTVVKENIDALEVRIWNYATAVWLANPEDRPQLRKLVQLAGTGGGPAAYPFTVIDGQEYFDGRPIFFTEEMKKLGDQGDLALICWSEYVEATRMLAFDQSIHVRFNSVENAFRFRMRNDGKPWWTSALTPRNRTGSTTLSPYVVLAERA